MLILSRYVGFDRGLQLASHCGNPKAAMPPLGAGECQRQLISGCLLENSPALHDLNSSTLGSYRDHSKQAVCIIVWARGKEELVVCAVRVVGGILAKLQCPNIVDLNRLALGVAKWA